MTKTSTGILLEGAGTEDQEERKLLVANLPNSLRKI